MDYFFISSEGEEATTPALAVREEVSGMRLALVLPHRGAVLDWPADEVASFEVWGIPELLSKLIKSLPQFHCKKKLEKSYGKKS